MRLHGLVYRARRHAAGGVGLCALGQVGGKDCAVHARAQAYSRLGEVNRSQHLPQRAVYVLRAPHGTPLAVGEYLVVTVDDSRRELHVRIPDVPERQIQAHAFFLVNLHVSVLLHPEQGRRDAVRVGEILNICAVFCQLFLEFLVGGLLTRVATLKKHVVAKALPGGKLVRAGLRHNLVHVAQRLHYPRPLLVGNDRPLALEPVGQLVRAHTHDKVVAAGLRLPQNVQVPHVEEVEHARGVTDDFFVHGQRSPYPAASVAAQSFFVRTGVPCMSKTTAPSTAPLLHSCRATPEKSAIS